MRHAAEALLTLTRTFCRARLGPHITGCNVALPCTPDDAFGSAINQLGRIQLLTR
jgi:hypothetical protein